MRTLLRPKRSTRRAVLEASLSAVVLVALPSCATQAFQRSRPAGIARGQEPLGAGNARLIDRPAEYTAEFESWVGDHVHWAGPSKWQIYEDGEWFFYSPRLAAMKRRSIYDACPAWLFSLDVRYFGERDALGSVIHAARYNFAHVIYKTHRDNVTAKGLDQRFAGLRNSIRSADYAQVVSPQELCKF